MARVGLGLLRMTLVAFTKNLHPTKRKQTFSFSVNMQQYPDRTRTIFFTKIKNEFKKHFN